MKKQNEKQWEQLIVSPEKAMTGIEHGMSIFIGTGLAEPRTLVKHLLSSDAGNLRDLELIQLASLGDAISPRKLSDHKYRLKTFFSGWVASEAITEGRVDLIPSRFSNIPGLIASRRIPVDVAFVQVTPPDEAGYCSLGIAVDAAYEAMEQASIVIGEINPATPVTFGDTFVPVTDFDYLIQSEDKPIYFDRWPVDDVFDQIAANVASVIPDGSCIGYSIGPLFEALSKYLVHKRNLGIHSPFFTDALMDLVKSGAVTNRKKTIWRGKSVASYAFGTADLMCWLDRNPLVEFQGVEKVFDAMQIGLNPGVIGLLPARKVDLSGNIALHFGKGNVAAGPGEVMDFSNGAEISEGGMTIFALPSRNLKQEANILISIKDYENQFSLRESLDMIISEYGVANLKGRTVRERAQALIEIAHPDDRQALVQQAKEEKILYEDQICLAEAANFYPSEIATQHTFKNDLTVRFRAIKPSDEEEMRRLFYRFSDQAVYYRYFSRIQLMPHKKMQKYVNVDYRKTMSIVGLTGEPGTARIIAEARFIKDNETPPFADVAFVVDEEHQGAGIASYLYKMLITIAKARGIRGFTADVLTSNSAMLKVFEKGGEPFQANIEHGAYEIRVPFSG